MIYGGALADHLSLPYLSFAFDNPFICGELFQRHRTAGVKFLCTDADSAPNPNCAPSVKDVGTLTYTQAASTSRQNCSA